VEAEALVVLVKPQQLPPLLEDYQVMQLTMVGLLVVAMVYGKII
jgi:hypothetical protein